MNFNRLSHAYIVSPELADTLAMAAVCSSETQQKPCKNCIQCTKAARAIHPDIIVVTKPSDKREILVDQIRELKSSAIIVPNDAEKKVYIITEADLMNNRAQNAFLQLLEEPPPHAVFILSTENPAALLQTVRSRCIESKGSTVTSDNDTDAEEVALEFFSALDSGNLALAAFMFKLEKLDKEAFQNFLKSSRVQLVSKLKAASQNASATACETLSRADRMFDKADDMLELNVSIGHISAMICAGLMTTTERNVH